MSVQGHIKRLWWGWGRGVAGHRWVRIEWRTPERPGRYSPGVRFWEVQWR